MKDYSHIKEGMFVSLAGIQASSDLEQQLLNAFVEAGAYPSEGRGKGCDYNLKCNYDYLGWGIGKGTFFTDDDETSRFTQEVTLDFILNGAKTYSEALQDTLASGDTDVSDQGENVSESITEGIKITPNTSFTLAIKGQELTLNEQELKELYNQLCYAEGKLHDFNLGD